jgi:hypothetical protein
MDQVDLALRSSRAYGWPMATAEPTAPALAVSKTPNKLSTTEKWWSALLVVLGSLLIIGILVWFGASTDDGGLKSKVTKVTEPSGQQAGNKTTETTDYADTVVIFALTVGAALVLSGAFYGRLRELKLGALTVGVGELPPDKKEKIAETADEALKEKQPDDTKRAVLTKAAEALAQERVRSDYWGVVPSPPDNYLEEVARQAASKVANATE